MSDWLTHSYLGLLICLRFFINCRWFLGFIQVLVNLYVFDLLFIS
jgi:hypothetical protein